MTRLQLLLVISLTVLFATVAGPAAASQHQYKSEAQDSLSFGPLKVKGYQLSGTAVKTKAGQAKGTALYLSLSKTAKGSTAFHTFSWTKGIKLTGSRDLSSGKLTARLGKFGRINLNFVPTKPTQTSGPGKDCVGKKGKSRRGRATGTFKFVADNRFFKTVKTGSFKSAFLSATPARTCEFQTGPTPTNQPVSLNTTGTGGLNVFITETKRHVNQNATLQQRSANPQIYRSISARTSDRGVFDVADNASSASANGIGPWLSGKLAYTATDYYAGGSNGKIKGGFAIKFDGVGTRRPFAAGDVGGFLSKPGFKPPNRNPTANFSSFEGGPREVTFSDASSDPDGNIVSWSWNFGDGQTATTANPSHTYATAGTYQVTLKVTDDDGGSATVTKSVTVTAPPPPPPNQNPTADFSYFESGPREATFSDESFDPDGNIVSWSWNFGDGQTATTANPSHTYATAGTYQVTLKVTDDDGGSATVAKSVTVTDAGP